MYYTMKNISTIFMAILMMLTARNSKGQRSYEISAFAETKINFFGYDYNGVRLGMRGGQPKGGGGGKLYYIRK